MLSLKELDQPKACETPYEFEVKNNADKGTGIFLSVIGGESPAITEYVQRFLQDRRVQDALNTKADPRGKRVHVVPIEEDMDFSVQAIALRIVSWRGEIAEPYSSENALALCKQNPWSIREQILTRSDDMSNFPLGRPTN